MARLKFKQKSDHLIWVRSIPDLTLSDQFHQKSHLSLGRIDLTLGPIE